MQQKQIQVGNKKLLALDMPEGASEPRIIKPHNKDKYFHFSCKTSEDKGFTTYVGKAFFYKDFGGKTKYPSDMKIIGFKNDITEKQWAEIVESGHSLATGRMVYMNYLTNKATFSTAHASGLSLLQANGILFENPYPKPPNPPEYMAIPVPTEKYIRAYKLWEEAERNIFKNCLIIQVI